MATTLTCFWSPKSITKSQKSCTELKNIEKLKREYNFIGHSKKLTQNGLKIYLFKKIMTMGKSRHMSTDKIITKYEKNIAIIDDKGATWTLGHMEGGKINLKIHQI